MWKCPVCNKANKDGTTICTECFYDNRNEPSGGDSRRAKREAGDLNARRDARKKRSEMFTPEVLTSAIKDTFSPEGTAPVIENDEEQEDLPARKLHRHERPESEKPAQKRRKFREDDSDSLLRAGKTYDEGFHIRPQHIVALCVLLIALVAVIVLFFSGKKASSSNIINSGYEITPAPVSTVTGAQEDAEVNVEDEDSEVVSSAGDTKVEELYPIILFGSYELDGSEENGSEALPWYIVAETADKMLLVSQYGIDMGYFYQNLISNEWTRSSIREYLNDSFYINAFTSAEREKILSTVTVDTITPGTEDSEQPEHNTVKDLIFLLSVDEAKTYFEDNKHRLCTPTESVSGSGAVTATNGCGWWWLRDSGDKEKAAVVSNSGYVYSRGYQVDLEFGLIRPAMWIEKYEDYPVPTPVPVVTPSPDN